MRRRGLTRSLATVLVLAGAVVAGCGEAPGSSGDDPDPAPTGTGAPPGASGPAVGTVDHVLAEAMPVPDDLDELDLGLDPDQLAAATSAPVAPGNLVPDPCDSRQTTPLQPAPTFTEARRGELTGRGPDGGVTLRTSVWRFGSQEESEAVLQQVEDRVAQCGPVHRGDGWDEVLAPGEGARSRDVAYTWRVSVLESRREVSAAWTTALGSLVLVEVTARGGTGADAPAALGHVAGRVLQAEADVVLAPPQTGDA